MSDAERSTVPQETFGSTGSLLFSRGSVSSYDLGNDEEEGGKFVVLHVDNYIMVRWPSCKVEEI